MDEKEYELWLCRVEGIRNAQQKILTENQPEEEEDEVTEEYFMLKRPAS